MGKMEDKIREFRHNAGNITSTRGGHCHIMVAEAAKKLAFAYYDCGARDNKFYKMFPKAEDFVAKQWGLYVAAGRAALANMLQQNHVPQEQKEMIVEALILDATLLKGRRNNIQVRPH